MAYSFLPPDDGRLIVEDIERTGMEACGRLGVGVCQPHRADGGRRRRVAQDLERRHAGGRLRLLVAAVHIGDGRMNADAGQRGADRDGAHFVGRQLDRDARHIGQTSW